MVHWPCVFTSLQHIQKLPKHSPFLAAKTSNLQSLAVLTAASELKPTYSSFHNSVLIDNISKNISNSLKSTHSHTYTETGIWNCQTHKQYERLQRSDPNLLKKLKNFKKFCWLVCLVFKNQTSSHILEVVFQWTYRLYSERQNERKNTWKTFNIYRKKWRASVFSNTQYNK